MDSAWWLLNLAYAVYVVSPVFKDMLRLRLVLLGATALFIAYGVASGIGSVVWWNVPFGLVHLYQIAVLVKERTAGELPDDLEQVRQQLFPTLSATDFSELWDMGEEVELLPHQTIIERGTDLSEVMLIMDGAADVHLGETILRLRPFALLGEMSLLTGEAASATVTTSGPTTLRRWDRTELLLLGDRKPHVQQAALLLISRQLVRKVPT